MEDRAHRKHAKLARATAGDWGRNELAILGAPCARIQQLAGDVIGRLAPKWHLAFADADHQAREGATPAHVHYLDQVSARRLTLAKDPNPFERRALLNDQDLVLVNGNHFGAEAQVVVLDPAKPLDRKLGRLTRVVLILSNAPGEALPAYLVQHLAGSSMPPVLPLDDTAAIADFIDQYLADRIPLLNGLVLAGGRSVRMGTDKGLLRYHQADQRTHVYHMLQPFCAEVALSCNASQEPEGDMAVLQDAFLGLGPVGGILTALQSAPDRAWLCVACDLPYLDAATLAYLVGRRNPAKFATAFRNEDQGFPEPMVAIWEPRSYPLLLQYLAMGYSCPRKVLLNADIELVTLPDQRFLENVNEPEAYQKAFQTINP